MKYFSLQNTGKRNIKEEHHTHYPLEEACGDEEMKIDRSGDNDANL